MHSNLYLELHQTPLESNQRKQFMSAIKILIVEDEMVIAAKISLNLTQLGYEVSGIVPRGEDAVIQCRESTPDLILLDVNLKGIIDGIETAQVLQKENINVPIIYLTANSDESTFARAKETRPYAFISKPYKKIDLQRAIELTISRLASENSKTNRSAAVPSTDNTPYILSDRIFVRQKNRMIKLFLTDILYVEAERSYCRIVTSDSEFLLSTPLKTLTEKLDPKYFFRLHRSYIINMQKIDEVAETHIVIASKAIPIGKSYKEDFSQRIQMI